MTIDVTLDCGQYQPFGPAGHGTMAEIKSALKESGFIFVGDDETVDNIWVTMSHHAMVVSSVGRENRTIGVQITKNNSAGEYEYIKATGAYDTLSLSEKYRLSGSAVSMETWLSQYDASGKPRPGDGKK